jgi:hypothetical protein
MSLYAALTDGADTVYLRRCTAGDDLYGDIEAYTQQVARRLPDGSFEDVTETWELIFDSKTDVDRASVLIQLGRFQEQIEDREENDLIDGWVWLHCSTPTENNPRYAVVKEIYVPSLDPRHYEANATVRLTLEITREGLWRDADPETGYDASLEDDDDIDNRVVSPDDNHIMLYETGSTRYGGDAPAVLKIGFTKAQAPPANYYERYIFALKKSRDADVFTYFNPHFNPVDEKNNGDQLVADSNAPGGYRIDYEASSGEVINYNWDLPAGATLEHYRGEYLVYAVAVPTVDITLQFRLNNIALADAISMSDYTVLPGDYAQMFLGRVSFPPYEIAPGVSQGTDDEFTILATWTGTTKTLKLRGWFLVPVDDGIVGVVNEDNDLNRVYFDGDRGIVYSVNTSPNPDVQVATSLKNLIGDYFAAPPKPYWAALYYYASLLHNSGNYDYNYDYFFDGDMLINHIRRYRTLRD